MALAISVPNTSSAARTQTQAATWTGISAGISLAATIPLVWMLTNPISQLMFVRGSEHDGDWGYVFLIALILTAPATYALFFGTAGELLKTRVSAAVHKTTMRVAALGIVPYLAMVITAMNWQSGPQFALVVTAGLTIPIAMLATIWTSTQRHA